MTIWHTLIRREGGGVAVAVICVGTTQVAVHAVMGTPHVSVRAAVAATPVVTAFADPEICTRSSSADPSVARLPAT